VTKNAAITLGLIEVPDTRRYGRVMVDVDGAVLRFEEKSDKKGRGWINAGMYLLNRDLLLTIPTDGPVSLEREILPAWIGRGLFGYRSQARFLDIGTPESYAFAEEFFAQARPRRDTTS
jgi:NDP-sugar pyrophosphorylase family protein